MSPLPGQRLISAGEDPDAFTARLGLLMKLHFEGVLMSENITQRWAIAGEVLPFNLADALAEINGWTDDSNEYQSCLRGWRDDLFRLAISGELTFKSAQGVPLPSCADAFYLGFVDLHDFCEWAARVGSTGMPKDPQALAKALGYEASERLPADPLVMFMSASGGVERDKAGPVEKEWVMKKAALIAKHAGQWPSIERDFQDATDNKLKSAANAPGHGEWFEAAALDWARQRGKLREGKQQGPADLTSVWTSTKHTIKG